jgi:hypothetical protein
MGGISEQTGVVVFVAVFYLRVCRLEGDGEGGKRKREEVDTDRLCDEWNEMESDYPFHCTYTPRSTTKEKNRVSLHYSPHAIEEKTPPLLLPLTNIPLPSRPKTFLILTNYSPIVIYTYIKTTDILFENAGGEKRESNPIQSSLARNSISQKIYWGASPVF